MGLFKNRNTLKARIQSLEETLGYIYTREDGYAEHVPRTYGDVIRLKEDVKEIKQKGKK